jgi:SOS response regulatory protein OraA/RecX
MKIEIIDNKRFADILVDGEKWKEVHRRLYKNYLREILRTSTKKDLSCLCLRIDTKLARMLVYKWLALRGFMKAELTKKLSSYKIDPRATAEVLLECEKLGYLDDKREGGLFIERAKRRGLGPQMIAMKLWQKAPELKDMARGSFTDGEQRELISEWIKKKTRSADLSEIKVKQRLYRFLISKGFDNSLVREQLLVDE